MQRNIYIFPLLKNHYSCPDTQETWCNLTFLISLVSPEAEPETWILVQIINLWDNSGSCGRWVGKCVREGKEERKAALPSNFPQWATGINGEVWEPVQNTRLRVVFLEGQGAGVFTRQCPSDIVWGLLEAGRVVNFLACLMKGQRGL